ncbi:MAG: ABC transporter permease subunit, partial [Bacilli bacterium]
IAILTSIIGTTVAYFTAYAVARISNKFAKIFHIISMISLAIPGIVLGLSYIMVFKGTFIYGTIIILVLVNIVHFFASPYLMAYNALCKLNPNYEIVGLTCGIKKSKIITNVIIPNTISTIIEMLGYFFVNAMITISAVAFLFNSETMPVSLLINQFDSQMMYEAAAVVSTVILFVNCIIKGIIYLIKRYIKF